MIKELQEQNQVLMTQVVALQMAIQELAAGRQPELKPEGYLVVRSNISGYTTIIHPDMRYRGVGGDRVINPFSEVAFPASWRDSPNLSVAIHKGVVSVREVDEIPDNLVTMPDLPTDGPVQVPQHRRIALGFALTGSDSDDGDVYSYSEPTRLLMGADIERDTGGIDVGYMQDIVMPVFELALKVEQGWRNRKWVVDLLEERISQILNLSRRR